MVMQSVMTLEPVKITVMSHVPMVGHVMDNNVPEIAQHKSARHCARGKQVPNEKRRRENKENMRREAQPYRRSNQSTLFIVMLLVQLPHIWKMVEREAM